MTTETQTKNHQAGTVEIAAQVCLKHGHDLADFPNAGSSNLLCKKCGLSLTEIRSGHL